MGLEEYLKNREILSARIMAIPRFINITIPDAHILKTTDDYVILKQNEIPVSVSVNRYDFITDIRLSVLAKHLRIVKSFKITTCNEFLWYDVALKRVKRIRARKYDDMTTGKTELLPFDIVYDGSDSGVLNFTLIFHTNKIYRNYFYNYESKIIRVDMEDEVVTRPAKEFVKKQHHISFWKYYHPIIIVRGRNNEKAPELFDRINSILYKFFEGFIKENFGDYPIDLDDIFSGITFNIDVAECTKLHAYINLNVVDDNQIILAELE